MTEEEKRRRWSNQEIKARVRAGRLCYVCEECPPVLLDEFGGWICAECRACYLRMLKIYHSRFFQEDHGSKDADTSRSQGTVRPRKSGGRKSSHDEHE